MNNFEYPNGPISPEQEELAQFASELFARVVRASQGKATYPLSATPLESGGVVVAQRVRGGGRIFVAPERTVLFVGSQLGTQQALDAFEAGRRTPIESFGPA